jgi:hypothetical protein
VKRLACVLALICAAALAPLAAPATAAPRPIVYVVVIDGLDGDAVEAGRAPFISSLLEGRGARAAYFPGSRSVMPAETNPNHVAMMSGAFPGRSGIPANAFALYAPLENEDSCRPTGPFDFTALPSTTSGENANCPQAELAFEAILRQDSRGRLRTAAVFGKPKLGRIFAGSHFRRRAHDVDYLWAPCASGEDDDDYCGEVPTNPVSGYAVDDATVMDRVIATFEQGVRAYGTQKRPDLTFVNLHQVDSAGHATGPGPVYHQAIAMADDEVERLVSRLRARGEWGRTVLILVSDHSMEATPTKIDLTARLEDAGIPPDSFVIVQNGSLDMVYLANRRAAGRFALLKRIREAALAVPGVADAVYREANPRDGGRRHTIARTHPDWHSAGTRSGDLLVTTEPGIAFSEGGFIGNPLPGNHGAPQTRDNFLAVVSGGAMVRQRAVPAAGRLGLPQNADLAPTVMGILGLFAPADSRGRFLSAAIARARLPRPARPRVRVTGRFRQQAGAAGRVRGRAGAQLGWRPGGGRYDVAVRRGARWRAKLRNTRRTRAWVRGATGARRCLRVRSISAAGRRGAWARRCVRL